ncbi:MAG: hypothetical protein IJ825_05625 [Oscillospiraceae bacterium]|nr:hypothetical protein [Oscillospiraceae bacterium]
MELFREVLKTPTSLLAFGILLLTVVLACVSGKVTEKRQKGRFLLWCLLPLIACLIHAAFLFPVGHTSLWMGVAIGDGVKMLYIPNGLDLFGLLYLSAAAALLMRLAAGRGWLRRVIAVLLCGAVGYCTVMQVFAQIYNYKCHNMTRLGWTAAFEQTVETMRREYILSEWKKIDYDALLETYRPKVAAAEAAGDEAAYAAALTEYAYDFYDGHVSLNAPQGKRFAIREQLAGNDYGLSLFTVDSGETIAVSVEEDTPAYRAGIRNGTVIEAWDGVPVQEAAAGVRCAYCGYGMHFPVRENEDRYRPFFLAGCGGETVTVTFRDASGVQQEAVLESMGSYRMRLGGSIASLRHDWIEDDNFTVRMLNDTCGYLRIDAEEYHPVPEHLAYLREGYYPQLTEEVHTMLTQLQEQGMQTLVIDLRNNSGGMNVVGAAVASLFTEEKQFQFAEGERKEGGYEITRSYYVFPDGRWKDLPVVVLVNQGCCSAGDGAAWFLSRCENVTLMGITPSNGINQNNGGECYLPGGLTIRYPVRLSLGEDGRPLIDTDAGRENRIPLDVVIPVDREAALQIFDPEAWDKDYELDYAAAYLSDR